MNNENLILIDKGYKSAINFAEKIYKDGGVFIYPTDTIYGFGGDPFNNNVVKLIDDIKGRGNNQKYILLINSVENLEEYIQVKNDKLLDFLARIWPAPVSIILQLKKNIAGSFDNSTAAFRIPDNKFCLDLLSKLNTPLISTSVNKSGTKPLNDINLILNEFGKQVDVIFYTEKKSKDTASTLIDLTENTPKLVREGSVKFESILQKYYS